MAELAAAVLRDARGAAARVDAMPAGSHVLMPKFVEAIEARALATIAGLNKDGNEPEAGLQPADQAQEAPTKVGKGPKRKKAKAATT